MKQWYEMRFENYSNKYQEVSFSQGIKCECDFIETEITLDKMTRLPDIGCSTGRHPAEPAKWGNSVVGIDFSGSMPAKALHKAQSENLNITFLRQDAPNLKFKHEFELVIIFCEGVFPLKETDEMNLYVLKNVSNALKFKGKFIFTTLNGLFPLFHSVKELFSDAAKIGKAKYHENPSDLLTLRDYNKTSIFDHEEDTLELECIERYYVPGKITGKLKSSGFETINIDGAKPGTFTGMMNLNSNDFEMLVIS